MSLKVTGKPSGCSRGMRRKQDTVRLHRLVLRWYAAHGRSLPWRRTRDPYRILLSEVMLQQTQVSRVLVKYRSFLRRFPDLGTLARASRKDVVLAWQGMGYNNRAVRLHTLARTVMAEHNGTLPADYESLIGLPGVGRYTANAVLASAFRRRVPIVDTNVHRVFSRLLSARESVSDRAVERFVWDEAFRLLPRVRVHEWNQALMDLGATVCTAAAPQCGVCPLCSLCHSAGLLGPARRARRLRNEPSFRGIPNRIYRGRIVELLRTPAAETGLTVNRIGRHLWAGFPPACLPRLQLLLASLERDGLVRVSQRRPALQRMVSLA